MKKYIAILSILCLMVSFGGCSTKKPAETTSPVISTETHPSNATLPGESASETTVPSTPANIPQQPMAAVFVPIQTENAVAEDGKIIFSHSFQNISLVAQDPDVADRVILDFLNQMDESNASAERIQQLARDNYDGTAEFNPYICHHTFTPTRSDQGVLSFFGEYAEYTGGTHASRNNISISYDMTNGHILTLANILQIGATTDAFPGLVIDILSQRDDLFDGYEQSVERRFSREASLDTEFYFTPSGMCFYFEPYEIAPYASGTISAEIPYEKLTGILDDSYFPAEKNETKGTLSVSAFDDTDLSQYNQIAEAVMDESGDMFLIYGNDTVQNVRIQFRTQHAEDRIVFLAQSLSPNDAIMLQASDEDTAHISILFENAEGEQSLSLTD